MAGIGYIKCGEGDDPRNMGKFVVRDETLWCMLLAVIGEGQGDTSADDPSMVGKT